MKKILVLSAAILALQAMPVLAEEGGPKPDGNHGKGMDRMFEMQDTNKDGAVSEDEYLAFGKARFAETDANKDGKITKEEIKAHRDAMREKYKAMKKEQEANKPAADKPAETPPAE